MELARASPSVGTEVVIASSISAEFPQLTQALWDS